MCSSERSLLLFGDCIRKSGLPRWRSGRESARQCRRCKRRGFSLWVGKIPWRRKWQSTLVFLPGKFHGQRNLVGYSSWGHKETDTTEHACTHMWSLPICIEIWEQKGPRTYFFPATGTLGRTDSERVLCQQEETVIKGDLWCGVYLGRQGLTGYLPAPHSLPRLSLRQRRSRLSLRQNLQSGGGEVWHMKRTHSVWAM